jgi:hypothetical protein
MTIGTNHFATKKAALKYYQQQCDGLATMSDIEDMIRANEIVIGKPKVNKGESLRLNDEKRYLIVTN